jgi:hypothetical protein
MISDPFVPIYYPYHLRNDTAASAYSGRTIDFAAWLGQKATGDSSVHYELPYPQTSYHLSMDALTTLGVITAWVAVERGDSSVDDFIETLQRHAYRNNPSRLFREAIQLAILSDAVEVARRLVTLGLQHDPDNDVLSAYHKLLAPPQVIQTGRHAGHDYAQSMRWLAAHSHEYVGQWVALRDGELLGSAPSRQLLTDMLGEVAKEPNVLLSRIPRA